MFVQEYGAYQHNFSKYYVLESVNGMSNKRYQVFLHFVLSNKNKCYVDDIVFQKNDCKQKSQQYNFTLDSIWK